MQKRYRLKLLLRRYILLLSLVFSVLAVPAQNEENERSKLTTVIIDPGHGGKDTGARGKLNLEKDIVLDIGIMVRDYLNKYLPGLNVIMTRDKDVFIPLNERARVANKNNADLFVSIHANYISNARIYGTETFVLGLHRSEENLEVAKKENSVIVLEDDYKAKYEGFDPNSTESYIIFELMQNVYLDQSIGFASAVQDQFEERVGRHNRGVKQAGFLVLRETAMPGVLVEVGFLSNKYEERFVASEEGKVFLASAIFRAIRDYKNRYDARNSQLVVRNHNSLQTEEGNPEKPDEIGEEKEIEYRIQVASSREPIDDNEGPYQHFDNVWEYKEGEYYKYTTAKASSHEKISEIMEGVRKVVPDCFIVGFKDGDRIIP